MSAKIPLEDFSKWLDKLQTEVTKDLGKSLLESTQILAGSIAETILNEPKAPSPANVRTGALARSYLEGVAFLGEAGGKIRAKTTSKLPYARIQDQGGFIQPKTRQNLSIPLNARAAAQWPRDWPKGALQLIKSKAGNLLLAEISGRGRIKPMYVLKKLVRIDPKFYLFEGFFKIQRQIDTKLANGVIEAFVET